MSREVKRVPLDFDWPLNKVWGGYLNPFYKQSIECSDCSGSGQSPEAKRFSDQWYGNAAFKPEDRGSVPYLPSDPPVRQLAERNVRRAPEFYGTTVEAIDREARRLCEYFNNQWSHHLNTNDVAALVKANRLRDLTHTWSKEGSWCEKNPPHIPTPKEVNDWSICGFGHDSINQWVVVQAECERLGYETSCKRCAGDGTLWPSKAIKQQAEDWKQTEPLAGDGYQIWETVSEGSPISPVFAEPRELARWMSHNSSGLDSETTEEQWFKFIVGPDWAPSMIGFAGQLKSGVQGIIEGD